MGTMELTHVQGQLNCGPSAARMQPPIISQRSCGSCGKFVANASLRLPKSPKLLKPLGLSGVGLSTCSKMPSGSTFVSGGFPTRQLSCSVRSASSVSVSLLQPDSLLHDIEVQELELETPSLVALCSDLDWKKHASDLREEALLSLLSVGERTLSLNVLDREMQLWLHDSMWEGVEIPSPADPAMNVPDEDLEAAVHDLRMQANALACQELAMTVDRTFDWESAAAELHKRVHGAEVSGSCGDQHHLWADWVDTQEKTAAPDNVVQDSIPTSAPSIVKRNASLAIGTALTGLLWEGFSTLGAVASESDGSNFDAIEAAARAPSWLVPSVLAFPVVSYLLFNVYREKVNPNARVTDWMFGVVTVVIVANLVMMATLGVRLY